VLRLRVIGRCRCSCRERVADAIHPYERVPQLTARVVWIDLERTLICDRTLDVVLLSKRDLIVASS
jgi:hypothetical protein